MAATRQCRSSLRRTVVDREIGAQEIGELVACSETGAPSIRRLHAEQARPAERVGVILSRRTVAADVPARSEFDGHVIILRRQIGRAKKIGGDDCGGTTSPVSVRREQVWSGNASNGFLRRTSWRAGHKL